MIPANEAGQDWPLLPDSNGAAARAMRSVREHIASGRCNPMPEFLPIEIRVLVSAHCQADGITTSTAMFPPGTTLLYHTHDCGEAITILEGNAVVSVEGRRYSLGWLDCIYIPEGIPHSVCNSHTDTVLLAHTAFPTAKPSRTLVIDIFRDQDRGAGCPKPGEPECLMRFGQAQMYTLADGTRFYDLFASRLGAVGMCGGYAEFGPGSSLPCHTHKFDESITIVAGESICLVEGKQYVLSGFDTAFVPEGKPHRFLNQSNRPMAMIWVYAGNEPERSLVSSDYCSGSRTWKGVDTLEGMDREQLEI